jgi:hypothetical protein
MYKIFILLPLLFVIGHSSGQVRPYHKLIRTNTFWDCTWWQYTGPGMTGCALTMDRIFFTDKDTVLEGMTYKVSYAYPMHSSPPDPWNCPPYAADTIAVEYQRYIREDTVARKVYIYYPDFLSWTFDQVLYDFSLQPGDSLKSRYQGDWVVTAVDSVMIGTGEYRKRTIFVVPTWGTGYYVEGIGGSQGLFTPMFTFEAYGVFLCLKENNVDLWGNHCDSWFVKVPEKKPARAAIFPNPVMDEITIETDGSTGNQVTIVDLNGQEIIRRTITGTHLKIDVSNFSKGFYQVRLTGKDNVSVGKFIKQ